MNMWEYIQICVNICDYKQIYADIREYLDIFKYAKWATWYTNPGPVSQWPLTADSSNLPTQQTGSYIKRRFFARIFIRGFFWVALYLQTFFGSFFPNFFYNLFGVRSCQHSRQPAISESQKQVRIKSVFWTKTLVELNHFLDDKICTNLEWGYPVVKIGFPFKFYWLVAIKGSLKHLQFEENYSSPPFGSKVCSNTSNITGFLIDMHCFISLPIILPFKDVPWLR